MEREIRPLEPAEIPELSRFLLQGFRTAPDAEFAAPEVLHWKYFDPRGDRDVPRSLVAREGGQIVGHVGMFHGWFQCAAEPDHPISTLHGIDWLSSVGHRNTGAYLMRRGHRLADTHYALNYSDAARRVIESAGYQRMGTVPVFQRILRPDYRLRTTGRRTLRSYTQAARDFARAAWYRSRPPSTTVPLRMVREFGTEVDAVLARCSRRVVYSSRRPAWLNHALRYPRSRVTGWLVQHQEQVRGFALLNVVRREAARIGKIVDCFLDDHAPELWHAALFALVQELCIQEADIAECFGSTTWMAQALRANGFHPAHHVHFLLHDEQALLPRNVAFHLTPFEGDYAYT